MYRFEAFIIWIDYILNQIYAAPIKQITTIDTIDMKGQNFTTKTNDNDDNEEE